MKAQSKQRLPRGTKLTPVVQDRIVLALRGGNHFETAALFAGVSFSALKDWLRRGAKEQERQDQGERVDPIEEPYRLFTTEAHKALAAAEVKALLTVTKASEQGDWKASAWILTHRHPSRWGNQVRLEGSEEQPVVVKESRIDVRKLSTSALEELLKAQEELTGAREDVEGDEG